ncbi:uncharacterized protein LOC116337005 [Contarinia nasturtii]|uniref:uncharacterized protein LOC116337005 n=1 Tax=Contarinia nasturtii TaxID=265458 RepID=UPI0012D44638|nr:uncharacterized protein LOC116337005 [Contarinia nasturtii]
MADSSGLENKRPRRGRSATKAGTSTSEPKTNAPEISSNSLLRLNDESLQKLFDHLDIESLCQMANVCKRFQPITQEAFSRRHREFVFKGRACKNSEFRRVLCKFGHLITSIDASQAYMADYNELLDASAIVKYCNNNLESVILQRATIDCDAFKPLFSRLKRIELFKCEFTGNKIDLFKNCPNLEIFSFHADFFGPDPLNFNYDRSIGFVVRKFPKLKCLGFDCNYVGFATFFDLLALNPHVKEIDIAAKSEDMFIQAIAEYSKNLESFAMHSGDSFPEEQTRKGFLKLSNLKKLQRLCIEAGDEIYGKLVGPLMDAFAKEKVPINYLDLSEFSIGPNDIKSILKLKTMKVLLLNNIEKAVTDADLVPLATQLPLLVHLQLDFGEKVKTPITVNGLVKMVKDGKQLKYLALVRVQNLKIDKKAFENILKAVQSRRNENKLTIDINTSSKKTTTFNVPEHVQQASSAHLKIRYSSE